MTDITEIWKFPLRRGKSNHPRYGACFMDAVSYLEYGTLGDHPECVCPVIAAFGRVINDAMSEEGRQRLRPFIHRVSGTVDPDSEQARAAYLAWQAVRVFAPFALEAAGLREQAAALRNFKGSLYDAAWIANAAAWNSRATNATTWAVSATTAATWAARAASRATNAIASDAAAKAAEAAGAVSRAAARAVAVAESAAIASDSASTVEDVMINALDGVLAIGRQAEAMDVQQARVAVRNFELASS